MNAAILAVVAGLAGAAAAGKPVLSVTVTVSPKAQAALAAKGKVVVVLAAMGELEDPAVTEYLQVPASGGTARFAGRDTRTGKALKLPVKADDDLVVNAISRPAGRPLADETNLLDCTAIGEPLRGAVGKSFTLACKLIGER